MISIKNLGFGIAIFLLTLFIGIYGINTFYSKGPDYNDFCPMYLGNQTSCVSAGGNWVPGETRIESGKSVQPAQVGSYCDYDYTSCQKNFETAEEKYFKVVFMIALPLGIIIIAVGALVFGLEFVGAGLIFGGVGILLYGVGGFWRFAQDWLKFSLSAVGLVVLIYLAYWMARRKKRKK